MKYSDTTLIVNRLNRAWILLFHLLRPKRVYYFDSGRGRGRIRFPERFIHLTNDAFIEAFPESLERSFRWVDSPRLSVSPDYRLCARVLKVLLSDAKPGERDVALKRLFHRTLYDRARKRTLIRYVSHQHSRPGHSVVDFTGSLAIADRSCPPPWFPVALLLNLGSMLKALLVKAASIACFLKVLVSFKLGSQPKRKLLDTVFVTYENHHLLASLCGALGKRGLSMGLFMMGEDLSGKYEQALRGGDYFRPSDLVCSPTFLWRFLKAFARWYASCVRIKDIETYKQAFHFLTRLVVYTCMFDNVKPRTLITNEDYQEFNPRYFAAKRAGCRVINVLISTLVPRYNPYLSFCLIDREVSAASLNRTVLEESGCWINRYVPLEGFRSYLHYMQPHYLRDRDLLRELLHARGLESGCSRIISYYSTGSKRNLSYIDIPMETKLVVLEYLRAYLEQNPDVILIVKLHPCETDTHLFQEEYRGLLAVERVIFLHNSVSSYALLEESDINVSDISSMGVHSRLFGLKTIVVNPHDIKVYFPREQTRQTRNYRYVTDKADLFRAIDELSALPRHERTPRLHSHEAEVFPEELARAVLRAGGFGCTPPITPEEAGGLALSQTRHEQAL